MTYLITDDTPGLTLEGLGPLLTDEELFALCQQNRDLRLERDERGRIYIMPPTGFETSVSNSELARQLGNWNFEHQLGKVTESNGGYYLPDTSMKAPDAAWISGERYERISAEERKTFPYLCPDFVVELMSESDVLSPSLRRMEKWMENGCRLAWLIDRKQQRVYVYRPDQPVEVLDGFDRRVSGEDVLPGFELVLKWL